MNARGTTPEVRKALDEAIAEGFTVSITAKGHYRVCDAQGRTVTMFAKTPSDGRSVLNSRAAMRRAIRARECDT